MKIERTDKETILTIPASMDLRVLHNAVNYLTIMEMGQKSKAKPKDIEALAKEAKKGFWAKNGKRLVK